MTTISSFAVEIGGDTSGFEVALRNARSQLGTFRGQVNSALSQLDRQVGGLTRTVGSAISGIGGLAGAFAAIGGGAALAAFRTTAQWADSLSELSDRVGVSTKALQELEFAGLKYGVSTETINRSVEVFNERLGQIATGGGGEARKALDRLGLTQRVLSGEFKTTEQALTAVLTETGKLRDTTVLAALGVDLFGRSGRELVPLLAAGEAGFRAAGDEAKRLGAVLSDDAIKALGEANDAIDRASLIISRQFTVALANAAPQVTALATAVANATPQIIENITSLLEWANIVEATPARIAQKRIAQLRADIQATEKALEPGQFGDTYDPRMSAFRARRFRLGAELAQQRLELERLTQSEAVRQAAIASIPAPTRERLGGGGGGRARSAVPTIARPRIPTPAELRAQFAEEDAARAFDRRLLSPPGLDRIGSAGRQISGAKVDWERWAEEGTTRALRSVENLDAAREFWRNATGEGLRAAFNGDLGSFLRQRLTDILGRAFEGVTDRIGDALFEGLRGQRGGGILSAIGSLFGGFRAAGGPVSARRAYIVGERGPELFAPGRSGTIIPNHALAGGGAVINVYANGAIDRAEIAAMVQQGVGLAAGASPAVTAAAQQRRSRFR